jgi:hypothetical protein
MARFELAGSAGGASPFFATVEPEFFANSIFIPYECRKYPVLDNRHPTAEAFDFAVEVVARQWVHSDEPLFRRDISVSAAALRFGAAMDGLCSGTGSQS